MANTLSSAVPEPKVHFNIRFVRIVEKYPSIYNYQIEEYSNRQHKLEAWKMIAAELSSSGITVAQCREKWRNMRICYTEYIRKYANDTPEQLNARSYLTEVMKFLRPFIRTREDYNIPDLSNTIRPKLEQSDEVELVISDEESNGIEQMEKPNIFTIQKEELDISPLDDIPNSYNTNRELPDLVPIERYPIDVSNSMNTELLNSNPRHQFLMSILPDLEKMSDRQMRKFRTRVSTAIEEILEDD